LKISVVIPTYNRADFIAEAIESVQNQTYKIDEIIVVDDGSSDFTCKVVSNYDVKYLKTPNKGVSSARNIGIKSSKNNWIAFLDSDDLWLKDKIEKQVNLHVNNPSILFSHTLEKWKRGDKFVKYPKKLAKPKGNCFLKNISTCKIACSSVLVHKSVFEKVGYFDENLRVCEDYDFYLRVSFAFDIGLVEKEAIIKRAGHPQLSSEIFAIDSYHVDSLVKFLNSKYSKEVKEEIIKKCKILINGAKKHNNQEIYAKYSTLLKESSDF
jgi:glycosyltransferase involved in cell wall biosynthesis